MSLLYRSIASALLCLGFTTGLQAQPAGEAAAAVPPPAGAYGYLGVFLGPGQGGALVTGVVPNSPAARAGLQPGDLITSAALAGGAASPIASDGDAGRWLMQSKPGDRVTLSYRRNEFDSTIDLTLDERPAPAAPAADPQATTPPSWYDRPVLLGVTVGRTPEDLRQRLQLPPPGGAYVLYVRPDYPAAAAGVPAGAVIWAVNGESIGNSTDFGRAVQAAGPGGSVTLSYYYGTRDVKRVVISLVDDPGSQTWQGRTPAASEVPAAAPAGGDRVAGLEAENARLAAEVRRLQQDLEIAQNYAAELKRRLDVMQSTGEGADPNAGADPAAAAPAEAPGGAAEPNPFDVFDGI